MDEILIRAEQRELMSNAELSKQRIDGAKLYAGTAAPIAQFRCVDMILPLGA